MTTAAGALPAAHTEQPLCQPRKTLILSDYKELKKASCLQPANF